MLEQIPPEIISLVVQHIREKGDLNNLSQTSKLLHQYVTPMLYRSITFYAFDEYNILGLGVGSFLEKSSPYLRFLKDLELAAPFHRRLRTRCPDDDISESDNDANGDETDESGSTSDEVDSEIENYTTDDEQDGETTDSERESGIYLRDSDVHERVSDLSSHLTHQEFLEALESELIPLFRSIADGSLRSFRWNLGTCVPEAVVEYLLNKQPQLLSLSITTDITCGAVLPYRSGLGTLSQLRHVSYTGDQESDIIDEALQRNTHRLKEIQIDYISQCHTPTWQLNVQSLRALTLSGVNFESKVDDLISTFNFSQLLSLKLRDCLEANQILDTLANASPRMRLTSFELNFTGCWFEQDNITPLKRFLQSFRGLEDLFILCRPLRNRDDQFWNSIFHHGSTLNRLVYHQTTIYHKRSDRPMNTLREFGHLGFLGICCLPVDLLSSLQQIFPRPKFKILHIRVTGWVTHDSIHEGTTERADWDFSNALPDVFSFADWVFSPDGLPGLEILAYGDFCYRGRQPNTLLCRAQTLAGATPDPTHNIHVPTSQPSYRAVTKGDFTLWETIQDNLDFLEACPEDSLLHQW